MVGGVLTNLVRLSLFLDHFLPLLPFFSNPPFHHSHPTHHLSFILSPSPTSFSNIHHSHPTLSPTPPRPESPSLSVTAYVWSEELIPLFSKLRQTLDSLLKVTMSSLAFKLMQVNTQITI